MGQGSSGGKMGTGIVGSFPMTLCTALGLFKSTPLPKFKKECFAKDNSLKNEILKYDQIP